MIRSKDKGIEPLDALEIALSNDFDTAWAKMAANLAKVGFETTSAVICRRTVETPFSHEDTKYLGTFISREFVSLMREYPEMQQTSRSLENIRVSAIPRTYFGDQLRAKEDSPLARRYNGFINKINLTAQALMPFHASIDDCVMVLGWWDFEDKNKAIALWERHGGAFSLSANYFCQGILEAFGPLCTNDEKLSPRERECLLWAATGRTTAEIASIINVADATVDEYFNRAMRKLGANTRAQACARAIITGILNP